MKYIDANTLRVRITDLCANANFYQQKAIEESNREDFVSSGGEIYAYAKVLSLLDSFQQEQPEVDLEKEIDKYCEPIQAWQIQEAPFSSMDDCARHFAEWGRKQVLQEIYEGKVKPVDKITAAWLDDDSKDKEDK